MKVKNLQARQRQLLHDWLDTNDGQLRFEILRELRAVERELSKQVMQSPFPAKRVKVYAVR